MNIKDYEAREFLKELAGGLLLALIAYGCFVLAGCM